MKSRWWQRLGRPSRWWSHRCCLKPSISRRSCRRLFPDQLHRRRVDDDEYPDEPVGELAVLDWQFGADGWLYAADDGRIHAVRGRRHHTYARASDADYWDFRVATHGDVTLTLDRDHLLRLMPRRRIVLDRAIPAQIEAFALDSTGRPFAIRDGRLMMWTEDGLRGVAIGALDGLPLT